MFRSGLLLLAFYAILIANGAFGGKNFRTHNAGNVKKIIRGRNASILNHPHLVSVHPNLQSLTELAELNADYCGGSMITSLLVLTTAHCLDKYTDMSKFYIRSFYGNSYEPRLLLHKVEAVYIHPDYNWSAPEKNIAVLKLFETYQSENYALIPINLPTKPIVKGSILKAAGWGPRSIETRNSQLQEVDIEVMAAIECKDKSPSFVRFSQGCTQGNRVNSGWYTSDTGGGVTVNGTIYGIMSYTIWESNPNLKGYYMVFTDVYEHKEFIESVMKATAKST